MMTRRRPMTLVRVVRAWAALGFAFGVTIGAAACGTSTESPAGATSTAPSTATAGDVASGDFSGIEAIVHQSNGLTFTAHYQASGADAYGRAFDTDAPATLVRKPPLTAFVVAPKRGVSRWLATPDDQYSCFVDDCYRLGKPHERQGDAGPGGTADWGVVLTKVAGNQFSPYAAVRLLKEFYTSTTKVTESTETIAGQTATCVREQTDAGASGAKWNGLQEYCFLDNGVLARLNQQGTWNNRPQSRQYTLTSFAATADETALMVPANAHVSNVG
jgi:hypothetical protein